MAHQAQTELRTYRLVQLDTCCAKVEWGGEGVTADEAEDPFVRVKGEVLDIRPLPLVCSWEPLDPCCRCHIALFSCDSNLRLVRRKPIGVDDEEARVVASPRQQRVLDDQIATAGKRAARSVGRIRTHLAARHEMKRIVKPGVCIEARCVQTVDVGLLNLDSTLLAHLVARTEAPRKLLVELPVR